MDLKCFKRLSNLKMSSRLQTYQQDGLENCPPACLVCWLAYPLDEISQQVHVHTLGISARANFRGQSFSPQLILTSLIILSLLLQFMDTFEFTTSSL